MKWSTNGSINAAFINFYYLSSDRLTGEQKQSALRFFVFRGGKQKTRGGSVLTRVLQERQLIVIIVVIIIFVSGVSAFFSNFLVEAAVMVFGSGFSALTSDFFIEILVVIVGNGFSAHTACFFSGHFVVLVSVVCHVAFLLDFIIGKKLCAASSIVLPLIELLNH